MMLTDGVFDSRPRSDQREEEMDPVKKERYVELLGTAKQRSIAIQLISKIATFVRDDRGKVLKDGQPGGPDGQSEVMQIRCDEVGRVLGRGGENIRRIEEESGARLELDRAEGRLKFSGNPEAAAKASKANITPEEATVEKVTEMHPFFKRFPKDQNGKIIVKCPGLKDCSFDSATQNIETKSLPGRNKRDAENDEMFRNLEAEDDLEKMKEACDPDAIQEDPDQHDALLACADMVNLITEKRDSLSRRKRSTDEEGLVEMALLTEGSFEGTVTAVSPTELSVTFTELPAGTYTVIVALEEGRGTAASSLSSLTSQMAVTAVSPSSGSVHGGQVLTVTGGGFSGNLTNTIVSIGEAPCVVVSTTPAEIICRTTNCTESCGELVVLSNWISESSTDFSYLQTSSPVVTSASAV